MKKGPIAVQRLERLTNLECYSRARVQSYRGVSRATYDSSTKDTKFEHFR
jgi:hypothetical protein